MWRAAVVAFAAIFSVISCTGDDTANQNDAGDSSVGATFDDGDDSGCAAIPTGFDAYPGYCCETASRYCSVHSDICSRTLEMAENPATYIGDASAGDASCVLESTNTCNGEVAFRTCAADSCATYFFDATSHLFVGFGNEVGGALFCAGAIAPIDCDDVFNPDASPCCAWQFKTIVQGDGDCRDETGDSGGAD